MFVSGSFSAGVVFLQSRARQEEALHHLLSHIQPANGALAGHPVTPAPRSCFRKSGAEFS